MKLHVGFFFSSLSLSLFPSKTSNLKIVPRGNFRSAYSSHSSVTGTAKLGGVKLQNFAEIAVSASFSTSNLQIINTPDRHLSTPCDFKFHEKAFKSGTIE